MGKLSHPKDTTFIAPGRDNKLAGLVARFIEWGPCWTWEVQYHLTSDPWHMQHIITVSSAFDSIDDHILDLRGE